MNAKREIQAILSTFETGRPSGDYAALAILTDGAGISYGIHQGTDRSGTLDAIVKEYVETCGTVDFRPHAATLASNLSATQPKHPDVLALVEDLRMASGEYAMRAAQHAVFDRLYWAPVEAIANNARAVLPLTWAALYDTAIHSGPHRIKKHRRTFREGPPSKGGDEKAWCIAYLRARLKWIEGFTSRRAATTKLVRSTRYRAVALLDLADRGAWDLETPFSLLMPGGSVTIR